MAITIEQVLAQWELVGVFDWILPFLLIFAVIFGILSSTGILGGNRGVNSIIAITIALLSLRLGFVQAFFTELFPRFAIGLIVLVIVAIMAGMFILPKDIKGWYIGLGIAGAVFALIAVIFTFDEFSWFGSFFWQENIGIIIIGVMLLILVIATFVTAKPRPAATEHTTPIGALRKMVGE